MVRQYVDVLTAKGLETVGSVLAAESVNAVIGGMMEVSQGTFEQSLLAPPMANGDLIAAATQLICLGLTC